jgi:hypothetical protein
MAHQLEEGRHENHVGRVGVRSDRPGQRIPLYWESLPRVAGVEARVQLVREAAGDRYEQLEVSALVQRVVVTEDRCQAVEALARRWPQLSPEELLQSPHVLLWQTSPSASLIDTYWSRTGAVSNPGMLPTITQVYTTLAYDHTHREE